MFFYTFVWQIILFVNTMQEFILTVTSSTFQMMYFFHTLLIVRLCFAARVCLLFTFILNTITHSKQTSRPFSEISSFLLSSTQTASFIWSF